MSKSSIVVLAVSLLSGCAIGVKQDYAAPLNLGVSTPATVAVAALDQRPYVVSGEKPATFVGLSRGGFGNPFDVNTQSGNPLATDISTAIVNSMKDKGVNARAVQLKAGTLDAQATNELRAAGAQRSVLLTLREWKGDTMMNVGFRYDMDLRVLDQSGKVLATKLQQGSENLGAAGFTPGGGHLILPRFQRMMEILFQDPEVARALQP